MPLARVPDNSSVTSLVFATGGGVCVSAVPLPPRDDRIERGDGPWGSTILAHRGRQAMASCIILANFTEQGIRNVKDSPKREDAFRKLCEKLGAKVKDARTQAGRTFSSGES
jgi:hypothetical protein